MFENLTAASPQSHDAPHIPDAPQLIEGLCQTPQGAFVVAVSNLSPDGCTVTAPANWTEEFDFLHLTLAGVVEVNGRVQNMQGRKAAIRFYGQISPVVIEHWRRRAA